MKEIKLMNSKKVMLCDNEDFEMLSKYNWRINEGGYACSWIWLKNSKKYKIVRSHRLIISAPDDMKVDHKDRNPLNNTRNNLRICTDIQNTHNKSLRCNSSTGYKGVSFVAKANKFCARITFNNKTYGVGHYLTVEEAAIAYDRAAIYLHKEFACLNFESSKDLPPTIIDINAIRTKSTKFRGVSIKKNVNSIKFRAYININNKQFHLGFFECDVAAAKAYNLKAVELFGENAVLNEVYI